MTIWTKDELTKIGSADQQQICSVQSDGTLSTGDSMGLVEVSLLCPS
jgi:hypothetical protein